MYFPYGGILGQGAEAKGCDINATIGMAFEEDGSALVMDSFKKGINLDKKAFLYAGSFGVPELRAKWREMQIEKNPSLKGKEFSNPVVTNALTHGLRISAELFAESGVQVVVPDLYWDNYSLVFEESAGAELSLFNTFKDGHFDTAAMKKALLAGEGKKILILNFPNNPTGAIMEEKDLREIAEVVVEKDLFVISDEIYSELTFDDDEGLEKTTATVKFAAYPYKIANIPCCYEAELPPIDWNNRDARTSIAVYNNSSHRILATIRANNAGGYIYKDGDMLAVYSTVGKEYAATTYLPIGRTEFAFTNTQETAGTVSITFTEEVF